jgi:hypothetical protein
VVAAAVEAGVQGGGVGGQGVVDVLVAQAALVEADYQGAVVVDAGAGGLELGRGRKGGRRQRKIATSVAVVSKILRTGLLMVLLSQTPTPCRGWALGVPGSPPAPPRLWPATASGRSLVAPGGGEHERSRPQPRWFSTRTVPVRRANGTLLSLCWTGKRAEFLRPGSRTIVRYRLGQARPDLDTSRSRRP